MALGVDATIGFPHRLAGAFERAPTFDAETGTFRLEFRADHAIKAPTEIFIPEVVQYPEGFVVELSDGDYTLERAPDRVGGYCILRYTPGPPGYVSIVVIKRADADDPGDRGCCVQTAADDKLLPSKPSSVVDFAEEASSADPAAGRSAAAIGRMKTR